MVIDQEVMRVTPVEAKVVEQGAPVVGDGFCLGDRGSGIVALEVDMHSKRCDVEMFGSVNGPALYIAADEHSLNLHPDHDRDKWTVVTYPSFGAEWRVLTAAIYRYTLLVLLMNSEMYEEAVDNDDHPATP